MAKLPGFQERFADLDGLRVRYFTAGSGEPLLLLHGLGGAASNWVELAPALAAERRVLALDLPGHGRSQPIPGKPGLDAFADVAARIAAREGMLPAPLVGHSAGALVGIRLALAQPQAVTGIVVAAGAGISTLRRRAQVGVEVLGMTRPARMIAPARATIARRPALRQAAFGWWGVSDAAALSEAAARGFLDGPALHLNTRNLGRPVVRDDPRLDLEAVRCPCLVLWGARDRWVPLRDGLEFARRLRAPLRVVADCGHLLIGERPEACLDAIRSLLSVVADQNGTSSSVSS